ncbi:transglutaminase-like domain-containing protein [Microbacterium flavum]|uniref:Transglutaminase domain-containing protein n=1 Tax=Microbacterium flavum TaxID=415216 RepID=A0ABS5XSW6_9MICO|nr:transglutaminase-like domain-containing protein [Microbacterium flavum]MBT8797618.1 transglutaminase domain-containing protein [Microbacterium flavum]
MRRIVAGSLYVGVGVLLAAVAAWPIYRSASFVLLVVAATALAAGIAALVRWRGWDVWAVLALLAATILIVGVPLAVPTRLTDAAGLIHGLGELGAGLVVGWKDLLTVDLPVGAYRNLLVPALVVFLVGTTFALLLSWRRSAVAVAAVPVVLAMSAFGLLFGRTDVSAPIELGPVTLHAPVETVIGLGALGSAVIWLSWRSRDARVAALRRAAASSGVRLRRSTRTGSRRLVLGAGMIALAGVAALAVPVAAVPAERSVLREATGPRIELSRAVSPLSSYRTMFQGAPGSPVDPQKRILFSVTGAAVPERVRLAVLDEYDGAVFRTGSDGSDFVRMASSRTPPAGTAVDADIVIGDLDGIWMPSAGTLASVRFAGTRAAALADAFYVDDTLDAAVQTAGWRPGDAYRLRASVPASAPLGTAESPGDAGAGPDAPASLRTWLQGHVTGTGGSALEGVVALLRQRGYLSHSLSESQTAWMADAGVDTFVPSAAGHSLARIDQMFTALLDREQDPRAAQAGNFVAAVGDDEQFSVAVALLARELGFPARVVVGARTSAQDADLSVCDGGTCRAEDLSAWVEVRSAAGEWIPVDATPQHAQAPSREVTAQPDPTVGTEVRPDAVEEVDPPKPAQEDTPTDVTRPDELDLAWLWTTLRVGGISLAVVLILVGPVLGILAAKALRRRARREAAAPADRIAGGWEEYLDAAADAGRTAPAASTRLEIAHALGSAAAPALAVSADRAVFSGGAATDDDAVEFWRIVDGERTAFAPTRWQRLRAAVSLRSFIPEGWKRPSPRTERGSRARSSVRRTE